MAARTDVGMQIQDSHMTVHESTRVGCGQRRSVTAPFDLAAASRAGKLVGRLLLATTAAWLAVTVCALAAPTRYCGSAPHMISNSVYATPNVSCSQARRLMKELLGGSRACYPSGYTPNPTCTLEGFYCSAHYHRAAGTTTGRCVKGRKLITGIAGP